VAQQAQRWSLGHCRREAKEWNVTLRSSRSRC
jgi:hypothetical protein